MRIFHVICLNHMDFLNKAAWIVVFIPLWSALAPAMTPVELRADGLAKPDIAKIITPRFTWRVDSEKRGQSQAAYQILVATSALKLAGHEGDLWDSGKAAVSRLPHVRYGGEPLAPGGRYFWKVRAWDADGNVTGWSEPSSFEVAPADACGNLLDVAAVPAGFFSSSNDLFGGIQEMVRNTLMANLVSVKASGWKRPDGIAATIETYLMNFDMSGFYAEVMLDPAAAAPTAGGEHQFYDWAMAHALLLERMHIHYGDLDLVGERLPHAIAWIDVVAAQRENGVVAYGCGDGENLGSPNERLLNTVMFVSTARRLAGLARLIKLEEKAARIDQYADESKPAWQKAFLDLKTGKVGEGTQSEQVLALAHGEPSEVAAKLIFAYLVEELMTIEEPPAATTGGMGTMALMEELTKRGRHDMALALANRRASPSWGWMLENDATMLWADWEGSEERKSNGYPDYGSISAWFFRWIGGIQPDEDAIAFDRIRIRPQVPHGIEWAKSSHQSIRGRIESNWETSREGARFEIVIPPDATAIVELPAGEILESGAPIADAAGVDVGEVANGIQTLRIGSGHYRFLVKP